ncbi:MAG: hypothetical protein LBR86_02215 [Tannerella sp.]|jgi:hypothetical protein|nr:hypothetical protein [Tannerella sp.]
MMPATAMAQTAVTVTTNADNGSGNLREAINSASDGDIIDCSAIEGQTVAVFLFCDRMICARAPCL